MNNILFSFCLYRITSRGLQGIVRFVFAEMELWHASIRDALQGSHLSAQLWVDAIVHSCHTMSMALAHGVVPENLYTPTQKGLWNSWVRRSLKLLYEAKLEFPEGLEDIFWNRDILQL